MDDVALAAPNEAAAAAGEQVARAGGNAVDVALAAAFVTMVNEVGIVSLSSGGFVTVQPADGSDPVTVDGWMDMPGRSGPGAAGTGPGGGAVPGAAGTGPGGGAGPGAAGTGPGGGAGPGAAEVSTGTWDVRTDYGGGVTVTIGAGSVATHGAVAAFEETHRRWGRLPWREVVAPAVEVARGGFRLGSASRFYLDYVHDDIFGWDDVSRAALHEADGSVTRGLVVVPDLASSLELIAAEGASALHTGDLARAVADDVLERGGLLGRDDLAAYRPVVRPALRLDVGAWRFGTAPPPSVGGTCVAAMLRLLDGVPGAADPAGWSSADVERLVEVQRTVLGHRLDVLDHSDDLMADALAYLASIPDGARSAGSTVHVSAADSSGGACSLTVSSGYGSGMVARGTGIWLNNCLGEQELNPRGLHGLAPGTRLLSNMAPSVGRHEDGTSLAIGSPGADRISTAVAQVLAGFVHGGMSLQHAVDHPRVHVHRAGRPDEVVMRETQLSMYYGGVAATLVHPDGRLEAAADPRRDGAVRLLHP